MNGMTDFWRRVRWSAFLAWHMRGQSRLPFLPPEQIRRLQARRLRSMIDHAYRFVPYYRRTLDRMKLKPHDFRTVEDLARLPIIEPCQLQTQTLQFVSTAHPPREYTLLLTGGSTGDPRPVYHQASGIFLNAAHGERERCMVAALVGRRFGYRETVIISQNSTAHTLQGFAATRGLLPKGIAISRQYLSLMDPPEKNIPLINQFRPDVIHTYGSYLETLFGHLARTGEPFHRPKVVTYSSDGLGEAAYRLIREQFGIPVLSTYQANEAFKIGFDCPHHLGLHLNIDLYPLRVVDSAGSDLPAGQTGEVVLSNLVNRAMVLLNYRLGDLAAMLDVACPCGRTLPLLSYPPGRSDDKILLPDGRCLHPQLARTVFTTERDVFQYQIVQHTPNRFEVKVITAPGANQEVMKNRVEDEFRKRFGQDVQVEVRFVDSIDRTRGGKFRPVICLCRQAGAPEGASHAS
jgi:phenylacetate-CoA ligase